MKEILIVVNPAARGGRTGQDWPRFAAKLQAAGLDFDAVLTDRPGQATELSRQALLEGRGLVVAAGGDGTISEVASGFLQTGEELASSPRFGVIPLGTGGDFRRTFSIPRDLDQVVQMLKTGTVRRIDAGRVSYSRPDGELGRAYFVNIADAGIGGEVVRRVESGLHLGNGGLTFALASLLTLLSWRNKPMSITVDGRGYELTAQQVVIANCQYYGGGMRVAPQAVPDDGLFEVLIGGDLTILESVRLLGPVRRGASLAGKKIQYLRGRHIEIASPERVRLDVDGEQPGYLPATIDILPGVIDLIVP
jgi:diacylglycerol kinase (ATP)